MKNLAPRRVDAQDNDASALDADVKAIAANLPTVAEPVPVELRPIQSAAKASLRVPFHSLRGLPRARPLG